MDRSPPVSSVHIISQARIQDWVAISFSGESSQPRDWTCVSWIGRWIFYHWATWEATRRTSESSIWVKSKVHPSKVKWKIRVCLEFNLGQSQYRKQAWLKKKKEMMTVMSAEWFLCGGHWAVLLSPLSLDITMIPISELRKVRLAPDPGANRQRRWKLLEGYQPQAPWIYTKLYYSLPRVSQVARW